MRGFSIPLFGVLSSLLFISLPVSVSADQLLETDSFTSCLKEDSTIRVNYIHIAYDKANESVIFDVSGTSSKVQNVTAVLNVTAYGISVYHNTFNPCDSSTYVEALCPVPEGTFAGSGIQSIPSKYANMVPAIAYTIPDIDAQATLELKDLDSDDDVLCISAEVTNGKTVALTSVSYAAAAVAGIAMVGGGLASLSSMIGGVAGVGGSGADPAANAALPSPTLGEVFGMFQGFATYGMLSVSYPEVVRKFQRDFAFSTGLITWTGLQGSIDSFRSATGGNLTNDNVQFLKNASLVFTSSTNSFKRSLIQEGTEGTLLERAVVTSVSNDTSTSNSTSSESEMQVIVSGIQGYVEQLSVPQANTFMTVLVIVAIVIAVIIVGILAFKVFLEVWSLFGSFPKRLVGFREHYWRTMTRAIVNLILLLWGTWVLYCIWEFTHGDSWAARILAGVTLAIFLGIIIFFTVRIRQCVKASEDGPRKLFWSKEQWLKYSMFYNGYKSKFWWMFIPVIIYEFAKACVLAFGNGHGMFQTIALLTIETIWLGVLLLLFPYVLKTGNAINPIIQVARVIMYACTLTFVDELGIKAVPSTAAGLAVIVIQAILAGVVAIMIIVNVFISLIKANPHRQRRKEAEKLNRDLDDLTPLDARNSLLLMSTANTKGPHHRTGSLTSTNHPYTHDVKATSPLIQMHSGESFQDENHHHPHAVPMTPYRGSSERELTPQARGLRHLHSESSEHLMSSAAPMSGRQPMLPNLAGYQGLEQGGRRGY